jgi:TPR repeat protein
MPSHADKRVALIIGNGAYTQAPHLPNPGHDAQDVAAALKRIGFETIVGLDLDQASMQDAAIRFARAARTADVALFYYSGHAIQYGGVNYLMPIDALLHDEADLRRMVRADEMLADLQQAKNLRILVLDSCRNNPLAEQLKRFIGSTRGIGIGRGLAPMESPDGTIISYATQAGRTADDGQGRNSPYTIAFLKHIADKEDIATVFHRISSSVVDTSKGTQRPELSLSFFGEFYLNGRLELTVRPPPVAPADPCAAAESHWKSAEAIGRVAVYKDHLAKFPNCPFAELAKARIESLEDKLVTVAPPVSPAPLITSDDRNRELARLDKIALDSYKLAADRGDPSAQVDLGFFYSEGRGGLPKDDHEAARLYKLAADQGSARAQTNLGFFYSEGRGGLPKDDRQAARLYKLAAEQGDVLACANLGVFYRDGRGGLPQDDGEALRLFKLAADRGDASAQVNLGFFYSEGRGGLPKDDREAARLYKLAADQGSARAQTNLGFFYRDGRGGLPKDDREAAQLYKLAADQGDTLALTNLGLFYSEGRGSLPKDDREAARLYKLAADRGDASAQVDLGFFYSEGRGGLAKDDSEAARLDKLAADQGSARAENNLGVFYRDGRGALPKNDCKANRLFKLAADQGDTLALTNLRALYRAGRGCLRENSH